MSIEEQVTAPVADVATATTITDETQGEIAQTTPEKSEAEAVPASQPDPKKTDPRQRKIAELSYRLREQDRHIDRLIGLAEKQVSARQPEDKPPKIEDFGTIDEYVDAKLEHRERQKTGKAEQAKTEQARTEDRSGGVSAIAQELILSGSEKYEDFEEKVFSPDVRISPIMADAILSLDDPAMRADVAYYLASNTKEAIQISRLHPARQAAEIGKLEMKLASKPEPKKPSLAPVPITPVGGNNTPADEIAPTMEYEKFLKVRYRQLGRK